MFLITFIQVGFNILTVKTWLFRGWMDSQNRIILPVKSNNSTDCIYTNFLGRQFPNQFTPQTRHGQVRVFSDFLYGTKTLIYIHKFSLKELQLKTWHSTYSKTFKNSLFSYFRCLAVFYVECRSSFPRSPYKKLCTRVIFPLQIFGES